MFEVSVCLFFNLGGRSASISRFLTTAITFSCFSFNELRLPSFFYVPLQLFLYYPRQCGSTKGDICHRLTCSGWTNYGRSRDCQFSGVYSGPFFLIQLSNNWTQEVRLLWSPATTEMIVNLIFCFIICSRYLTRKIGFEAVMRVRCTKGKLQAVSA